MTVIFISLFLCLYIFLWNYSLTNLMYNKKHLLQTINLFIIFLPLWLIVGVLYLLLLLILNILKYIIIFFNFIIKHRGNVFDRFLTILDDVIKFEINNYKMSIFVLNLLNEKCDEYDFYYVKNVDLLANYFVSIIRCGVSKEFINIKMDDFIDSYKNNVSVLEWISRDNSFED